MRRLFPGATDRLLEDPDVVARIRTDSRAFIEELRAPAILDEVQATPEILGRSPFLGALFEGFAGTGRARHLYHFRDQQGLEIDFVVPAGHRRLVLVAATASRTVVPRRGASLDRLSATVKRYRVSRFLVYRPQGAARLSALRPGVQAGDLERQCFLRML